MPFWLSAILCLVSFSVDSFQYQPPQPPPTTTKKNPAIANKNDGTCPSTSFPELIRAAVASTLLIFHSMSGAFASADPAILESSSTSSPSAGLMGTSPVFDSFDEIPPIEEAVLRGSKTTIIKLREITDDKCKVQTQFGDVLEIDYIPKRLSPPATVYDASIFRGTGQPFKFVLGSGVMIPGVDQGLYDMCPGDIRLLKVPPKLAVGLLDPPAKAPLEWTVELVSIDGIIRKENNDELTREERNMGEIDESRLKDFER